MISCRDCWLWAKPGYNTMTRRQINTHWSGGMAAHSAQKNSECKIPLESSRLDFLGSRRHPPHWLSSKGPNYQRRVLLISAGAIEGLFKEKRHGNSPRGSCSCMTMPRLTGHLQPGRNLSTWASNDLITHPILRIWPLRTTTCYVNWKTNWKFAIFRPTRKSLLPRRPGWTDNLLNLFFWVACKSQSNGLKSVFSFVGSMFNKSRVFVAVACFLPGRAKDLSAPTRILRLIIIHTVMIYRHSKRWSSP